MRSDLLLHVTKMSATMTPLHEHFSRSRGMLDKLGFELGDPPVGKADAGACGLQPFFEVRLPAVSWRTRCFSVVFR